MTSSSIEIKNLASTVQPSCDQFRVEAKMCYYNVLGLPRNASNDEIASAYRRLALKWHPEKLSSCEENKILHFQLVSEAYEILSDKLKRFLYDHYGNEGLFQNLLESGIKHDLPPPRDPFVVYSEFFGTASPFAEFLSAKAWSDNNGSKAFDRGLIKSETRELQITLREAMTGVQKCIDGQLIQVPPGTIDGALICFKHMPENEPKSRIAVVVRLLPHPFLHLTSDGSGDLVYTHRVSLWDVLLGHTVSLEDLEGATLNVPVHHIISPTSNHRLRGRGGIGIGGTRGDIVICFDIKFPRALNDEQRKAIMQAKRAENL